MMWMRRGRGKDRLVRPRRRCRVTLLVERLEARYLPAINQLGGFPGTDHTQARSGEPPDTEVAAGPGMIVETVNTTVTFFSKATGAVVGREDLHQFFGPAGVSPSAFLSDPRVTFDELAGRFVVSVLEISDVNRASFLNLAVSNDADPTHGFADMHHLSIKETDSAGSLWGDFPKIGYNADAYVFTVNMLSFPTSRGAFAHVQIITIDKASVLDGNPNTITVYHVDRGLPEDFSLAPAVTHGAAPGAPMWLVEENGDRSHLRFVRMSNVLGNAPAFSDFVVPVPAYGEVVPPTQPNGRAITDNLDTAILNVAVRGNVLVADHNVGNGGVTHARWYEFVLSSGAPALFQAGEIDRGPSVDTFFPAIDVAPGGELGLSFIESSPAEFMSMYVTGRAPADIGNVMDLPVEEVGGVANYQGSRAGDFSGISIDPVNGTFWAANEFSTSAFSPNWGTWIAHFLPRHQYSYFATGADAGSPPEVHLYDADTGLLIRSFFAYDPTFTGGVRVAVGDVNGDGIPDVITVPGPGGGSDVRVWDGNTGALIRAFLAYGPSVFSGAYVAAGDVNGDGFADIIIGADTGGGPHVVVVSGRDNSILYSFMAYETDFFGGVRVAAGDINGDGKADIITAAGPGGGPHVKAFSGADVALLQSFFAYDPTSFFGGVYVAAGDLDGDGKADIITGAGAGGGPHVKVFSGATGSLLQSFFAYDPASFFGGVRVAAMTDTDGRAAILTAAGPGGGPHVEEFDGVTLSLRDSFFAYSAFFTGGVFIGGH
jgi:hypothetical protein